MAHIVHCVRHAQLVKQYTAVLDDDQIIDPSLTPFGQEQCASLNATFPHHNKISLIICSPLRRTISTAVLGFADSLTNGHCHPVVVALPEIQETSGFPCDIGSDVDKLCRETTEKDVPVDLSLVKPGWNIKTWDSKWSSLPWALASRALEARRYIRDKILELQELGKQNPEIVVLCHAGFLRYLTQDWQDCRYHQGSDWHNAEYRSFIFADLHTDDQNLTLQETIESRTRRGKSEHQALHDRHVDVAPTTCNADTE